MDPAAASPTPTPGAAAHAGRAQPRLGDRVPVSERPGDVVVTPRRVWVTSAYATTIAGLDPHRSTLAANPGGLELGTSGAALGFRTIWVINRRMNTLIALDPRRHVPAHTIAMPPEPQEVRAGFGAVWVLTKGDPNMLVRVDPRTFTVTAERTLPGRAGGYLASGHGALYVSNVISNRLLRIDPQTLRINRSVLAGVHPRGVTVGHGSVWVADPPMDAVLRFSYDLSRRHVVAVGRRPYQVTAGPAGVWASNLHGGTVVRIDPHRARVTGHPVHVGRGPFAMAASRHRLWVTLVVDNAVARVDVP